MTSRRHFLPRRAAPAVVHFTRSRNERGQNQLCVYAECLYSGVRVGPVWSHSKAAVSRVLATLTHSCDCGRPYHCHSFTEGRCVRPVG
jgi:hypothetical protein